MKALRSCRTHGTSHFPGIGSFLNGPCRRVPRTHFRTYTELSCQANTKHIILLTKHRVLYNLLQT
jgi:hypothetical protein